MQLDILVWLLPLLVLRFHARNQAILLSKETINKVASLVKETFWTVI